MTQSYSSSLDKACPGTWEPSVTVPNISGPKSMERECGALFRAAFARDVGPGAHLLLVSLTALVLAWPPALPTGQPVWASCSARP